MSHRPVAPRPLRAALAVLLASTLAFAACGRDDASEGASAAPSTPAATTPATTPAETTPPSTPEDASAEDEAKQSKSSRGGDTKAPAGDASMPEAEFKAGTPEDKARAALKQAGFKVSTYLATGNAQSSIKVDDDAVVAFYATPAAAKEEAAAFKTAFDSKAPVYGLVETKGPVLYMVTMSEKLSAKDKARFRKMVSTVEATR